MKYFVIATDTQGAPVAIGPLDGPPGDELMDEIEGWGWTVLSGCARKLTVSQARREAAS